MRCDAMNFNQFKIYILLGTNFNTFNRFIAFSTFHWHLKTTKDCTGLAMHLWPNEKKMQYTPPNIFYHVCELNVQWTMWICNDRTTKSIEKSCPWNAMSKYILCIYIEREHPRFALIECIMHAMITVIKRYMHISICMGSIV